VEAKIPEERFLVSVGSGTILINLMVGTAKTKKQPTCTKEKERENKTTINLCSGCQPPSDASCQYKK